jgi:VIT family/Histidine phosphatase superfamily (branch 1)
MSTGAFLAARSEAEVVAANVERERQEIVEHPEEEQEELSLFYQVKGIDEASADRLAATIGQHPNARLEALSAQELGVMEAGTGAREGIFPDVVHTSLLKRAIQTTNITLEAADLQWLTVRRSWRLNERHYGALQGKNKAQTRKEFG